jgi:phage-related protein
MEAGYLLRLLQRGESIGLPHSRPLPSIGSNCHELRINDTSSTWRVVYKVAPDAIIILEVFSKKTQSIPREVVEVCRRRLRLYEGI